MIKRKDLFEESCNRLIEQREFYKDMRSTAKAAAVQFDLKLPDIMALKDYVHYHKMDWDSNPLESDNTADYKDKLMQPFRKMAEAIDVLRNTGSLELLDPMIKALNDIGIHLTIDDNVKFEKNKDLMPFILLMSSSQKSICELADERKANGDISKELKDSTPRSFTQYVSTYASYKVAKEKGKDTSKLEDKLHDLAMNVGIDGEVYTTLEEDLKNI